MPLCNNKCLDILLNYQSRPIAWKGYKDTGLNCSLIITGDTLDDVLRYVVLFYGPAWLNIFFVLWCYIKTFRKLKQEFSDSPKIYYSIMKSFGYPLILSLAWIIATIDRFYQIIEGQPSFALAILHLILCEAQGLWNALYLTINRSDQFKKCCIYVNRSFDSRNSEQIICKSEANIPNSNDQTLHLLNEDSLQGSSV